MTPPPSGNRPADRMVPWYRQAFQQEYLDLYLHRDQAEAARAVEFLSHVMPLRGDQTLLDLCCGPGRHLTFLKEHVCRAVGLDLSADLLTRAREHCEEVHIGDPCPPARLIQADMRRLPLADAFFDRVVNLFTSFGYFTSEVQNQATLNEISRVMKPAGRFVIDHIHRERLLATLEPRTERRLSSGTTVLEEREWDESSARVSKHVTMQTARGEVKQWHETVRVYHPDELEAMLAQAGLSPQKRYADYAGSEWSGHAERLIILAEKR